MRIFSLFAALVALVLISAPANACGRLGHLFHRGSASSSCAPQAISPQTMAPPIATAPTDAPVVVQAPGVSVQVGGCANGSCGTMQSGFQGGFFHRIR